MDKLPTADYFEMMYPKNNHELSAGTCIIISGLCFMGIGALALATHGNVAIALPCLLIGLSLILAGIGMHLHEHLWQSPALRSSKGMFSDQKKPPEQPIAMLTINH